MVVTTSRKPRDGLGSQVRRKPRVLLLSRYYPQGLGELATELKAGDVADAMVVHCGCEGLEIVERKPGDEGVAVGILTQRYYQRHGFSMLRLTESASKYITPYFIQACESRGYDPKEYLDGERLNEVGEFYVKALGVEAVRRLVEWQPDAVGLRMDGGEPNKVAFDWLRDQNTVLRLFTDACIVGGGSLVSNFPKLTLVKTNADFLITCEGEKSFSRLVQLIGEHRTEKGLDGFYREASDIPGLVYRYGGRVYHNTLPADGWGITALERPTSSTVISDADLRNRKRPFIPSKDLRPVDPTVFENFGIEGFYEWFVFSSRGCSGLCTFCENPGGRTHRRKNPKVLMREITALDNEVSAGRFRFRPVESVNIVHMDTGGKLVLEIGDADFFQNKRHAMQFLRLFKKSPLSDKYMLVSQANPRSLMVGKEVDEDLAGLIKEVGGLIRVGFENPDDNFLKRIRKRHTLSDFEKVVSSFDCDTLQLSLFTILSDKDSTCEEYISVVKYMLDLKKRHPRIAFGLHPGVVPLPESEEGKFLPLLDGYLKGSDSADIRELAAFDVSKLDVFYRPRESEVDPLVNPLIRDTLPALKLVLNKNDYNPALAENLLFEMGFALHNLSRTLGEETKPRVKRLVGML